MTRIRFEGTLSGRRVLHRHPQRRGHHTQTHLPCHAHGLGAGLGDPRKATVAPQRYLGCILPVVRAMTTTLLCTGCGWLDVPAQFDWQRGDPMRASVRDDPRSEACPSCGGHDWAEVDAPTSLRVLEQADAAEALSRRSPLARAWHRGWAVTRGFVLVAIGLVAVVFLLAGVTSGARSLLEIYLLLIGVGMGMTVAVVNALRDVRDARPAIAPARWRMALPRVHSQGRGSTGVAHATGPLLVAPLSGQPCIGYELGIRHDRDPAAPVTSWLLLEQRSTAFVVGDAQYEPDGVLLSLPRMVFESETIEPATLTTLLRQRGFASDHRLVLFEAVLLDDSAVEVTLASVRTGPRRRGELPAVRLRHALGAGPT